MTYEEFHPYSFTDAAGQPQGMSIDIMRRIADTAGRKVVFLPNRNPAGMLEELRSGAAEVTSLLALTPERLAAGLATQKLGAFELQVFVRGSGSIQNLGDLTGTTVGVVRGSFAISGARLIPFANLVEFETTDDLILPLLTGEIDAVVSAHNSFLMRLRMAEVEDRIAPLSPPLVTSAYGFVVAADNEPLRAQLNAAIDSSISAEFLAKLEQTWFGRSRTLWDNVLVRWGLLISAAMLAAILVLGYWFFYYRNQSAELTRDRASDQLLIGALDEVAAAIVIFDSDLKAIHWNHGFEVIFPSMVPSLKKGATMRQMILQSYFDGTIQNDLSDAEILKKVDGIIEALHRGQSEMRKVRTQDGRVFQARDVRLGAGHFASLRVDVTQLQHQQDTIAQQAVSLEVANEELRTFSAIAAHDLKAPLFSLLNLIEFMAEDMEEAGITLPQDVEANWLQMERLSHRMMRLVQDLLVYTTTQSESHRSEVIEPSPRLQEVLDLAGPREGIEVIIEANMPHLRVNPIAFDMVMRNLIVNALQHHDRNRGTIILSAQSDGDVVTLSLQDDGPGIPEEHREQIFAPFHRLSASTEGSGLGLAFVKKTVESWGGNVQVRPAQPRGAVFEVSFPRSAMQSETVDLRQTAG
ncbi:MULTISPECIES: transporter substrate-binding domain-containing protein [Phaeobacter]|uniref:histidine kinase n=1 Tax=Phaeobacter piscinae TaxID=1580596 RepID=A0ABN5DN17_9RHOB|nr:MULTISPECIES: transporter substrate-binding domain-containing protein [Phaeobacter]ATG37889.1 two-component system sensor-like protein [Phaeobacter piscinae]AUQ88410.1 two-component system sensor-like protein [Phaeobacter piscinae]AUR26293.1 two-component system sensor-like protein [Phaeobacter piscinae]